MGLQAITTCRAVRMLDCEVEIFEAVDPATDGRDGWYFRTRGQRPGGGWTQWVTHGHRPPAPSEGAARAAARRYAEAVRDSDTDDA